MHDTKVHELSSVLARKPAGELPVGRPWWNPQRTSQMPAAKYYRDPIVTGFSDRTWPSRTLTQAPLWCSVDLRDGNQALPRPMDPHRKMLMFDLMIGMGFKEIEVGYPSASQPDFEFVRHLIEHDRIPDDVTISVFTPARAELVERTMESIQGAHRAMVHLYSATAPQWRQVVFGVDRAGLLAMTARSARLILDLSEAVNTDIRFEYSPEAFTATEPDFALEVCNAVTGIWDANPDRPVTINLPSTVEITPAHVFADQIEWMHRRLERRNGIILSVHPHNDRGTAVAAAECALLAGADRLEGCLFSGGERTGNVCLPTVALNLFSAGIDPELDFSDIDGIRRVVEYCTGLRVPDRHPYVGDYVYTAFSGTHQDAINKGLRVRQDDGRNEKEIAWNVPYLPIDPQDVGRDYESVVRINSQSGKGGIAYLLASHYDLHLPRGMQIELSRLVQKRAEASGGELTSKELWGLFEEEFLTCSGVLGLTGLEWDGSSPARLTHATVSTPQGNLEFEPSGDIVQVLLGLLRQAGYRVRLQQQSHHTTKLRGQARVAVYVQVTVDGHPAWGAGIDAQAEIAAAAAIVCALNRALSNEMAAMDQATGEQAS